MVYGTDRMTMRAIIIDDEFDDHTAAGRSLRALAAALGASGVELTVSATAADGAASVSADASLQCAIIDWDIGTGDDKEEATELLQNLRTHNAAMPIFLLADRSMAASIPAQAMQQGG